MSRPDRVPVTILTGYLGAGKTTLLNHLLGAPHGKRIAVIENEYGAVSIDHALVVNAEDGIFEMANGCICCTVRDDLVRLLGRLVDRGDAFDHVVIETTGLAEPGPVAQTFFEGGPIQARFALDGVVTLVDAAHVIEQLGRGNEARGQIEFANTLILNKTDLVDADRLAAVEARLRAINPLARICRAERAAVPLEVVLGLDAFAPERLLDRPPRAPDRHRGDADDEHGRDHEHEHDHKHDHDHDHDETVSSVVVEAEGDVNPTALDLWLWQILRNSGRNIFRMKGFISLRGEPRRFVVQAVHTVFDAGPGAPWGDAPRRNQLVFIGRDLDADALARGLEACVD